jgi:hypothetical protein
MAHPWCSLSLASIRFLFVHFVLHSPDGGGIVIVVFHGHRSRSTENSLARRRECPQVHGERRLIHFHRGAGPKLAMHGKFA